MNAFQYPAKSLVGDYVRAGIGLAVGLGVLASLAASRVIESLLFELTPTDASAIVQAVVVMTVVALVAAYLPARRAARVDPLIALRCD